MTMIIYNDPETGILVEMWPCLHEINPATNKPFTVQEVADKDVPDGVSYSIVEDSSVPTDLSFRDAWKGVGIGTTGATVTEDITKAKEIHKTNIRLARASKFTDLDIEYQRAIETSADTSAIVAKKQALRDAPAASGITTAANVTDLKTQWDTSILGTSPYS
jgi:hypothetical protein|tara:strand:+ start:43 stop:528 length:486 start_codon:yes stop_codon:yes gene_type:complete